MIVQIVGIHTVNITVLGSFREDLPQGFVFGCIPFHLEMLVGLKNMLTYLQKEDLQSLLWERAVV